VLLGFALDYARVVFLLHERSVKKVMIITASSLTGFAV